MKIIFQGSAAAAAAAELVRVGSTSQELNHRFWRLISELVGF